jgi:hypothetical protein
VLDGAEVHALVSLGNLGLITDGVADRVDFCPAVDVASLDDQRVPVPSSDGFTKPRWRQARRVTAAVDRHDMEHRILLE